MIEITTQASGQVRARYKVTLGDGRVFDVGPINCASIADAESKEAGIEQRMIEQVAESDAEDAVNTGLTLTTNRQRRACLKAGMQAEQSYAAYALMIRVMPDLLALNRTKPHKRTACHLARREHRDSAEDKSEMAISHRQRGDDYSI